MRNTVSKIKTLVFYAFLLTGFSQLAIGNPTTTQNQTQYNRPEDNKRMWSSLSGCRSYAPSVTLPSINYSNTKLSVDASEAEYGEKKDQYLNSLYEHIKQSKNPSEIQKLQKCINTALNTNLSAIDNDYEKNKSTCKEAKSEMDKAVNEMLKDCNKANMGDFSGCVNQAKACRKCSPLNEDSVTSEDCDEGDVGEVEAYGSGIQTILMQGQNVRATPDIQKSFKKFARCPALAAEEYEKMKDEVEKSEEKTRDLQSKLHDYQEKANELAEEQQNAENAIQAEMDELEQEIEQKILEFSEKEGDAKNEKEMTVGKLAELINEAEEGIRELDLKKHDAKIAYNAKVADASGKCHGAALEKLKQLNTRKQELIQASLYSAGGFSNLMNSTGLSSRDKMQKIVDKYYRECKGDRAFKENMSLLDQTLKSEYAKIEDAKRRLKNRIGILKKQLDSAEKKLPEVLSKIYEALQSFKNQAEKKLTRLQQKLVQTKDKFEKAQNNLNQRITQTQQQLQQEQMYLQQKQAYLALQHQFSAGMSSDKGAANEAMGSATTAINSISSVLTSCSCDSDNPVDFASCDLACGYQKSHLEDVTSECAAYFKAKEALKGKKAN